MIIEDSGLNGMKSDLAHLDEAATSLGFVRWQWEYYRATYDLKLHDVKSKADFFLRINTRAVEGKLEHPDTVLSVESIYLGKANFPHGLEYETVAPKDLLALANQKLSQLKQQLS